MDASREISKLRIRQISRERGSVGIPVRQRRPRVVDVHLAALDGPRGPGLEVPGDESANLVVRSLPFVVPPIPWVSSPRQEDVAGDVRGLDGGVDEVLGVGPYPRALHRSEQLARAVQVRQPDQRRLVHRIGGARARGEVARGLGASKENNDV